MVTLTAQQNHTFYNVDSDGLCSAINPPTLNQLKIYLIILKLYYDATYPDLLIKWDRLFSSRKP